LQIGPLIALISLRPVRLHHPCCANATGRIVVSALFCIYSEGYLSNLCARGRAAQAGGSSRRQGLRWDRNSRGLTLHTLQQPHQFAHPDIRRQWLRVEWSGQALDLLSL